jgi:tRNA dimethylallyltransferase
LGLASKINKKLIIVAGPTASGKTGLAIELAQYFQTEIVSADSRQIYKELNIGVALPSKQELSSASHHFIHSHSIHSPLNAYDYSVQAIKKAEELFQKHNVVIMAGGSGLFLKAVYDGIDDFPDPTPALRSELNTLKKENFESMLVQLQKLDPEYYAIADKQNPARIQRALEVCITSGVKYSQLCKAEKRQLPFQVIKTALMPSRELLDERIHSRLELMRKAGLTNEAYELIQFRHLSPLKTIGYRELFEHFDGKMSEDEAYEKIRVNTRRYAKKQITWLKRENDFRFFDSGSILECNEL